ncbi:MAG: peptidase M28, partial [Maribacter sp.]
MKKTALLPILILLLIGNFCFAQSTEEIVAAIQKEAYDNSQLEQLAYELMDVNGPRLVGTPQMKTAHDWAVNTYKKWGITAENQEWGKWRGWERGITHVDMVSPRIASLHATQLAWNPGTGKNGVTAALITLPTISDSLAFVKWLPNVRGKIVMVSMLQPTGRPDYNWEEFATPESFEKMKIEREAQDKAWRENFENTGYTSRTMNAALEKAGALGIAQSRWSEGFGANKIFSAGTDKIPVVDLSLEDYGMLYRMAMK